MGELHLSNAQIATITILVLVAGAYSLLPPTTTVESKGVLPVPTVQVLPPSKTPPVVVDDRLEKLTEKVERIVERDEQESKDYHLPQVVVESLESEAVQLVKGSACYANDWNYRIEAAQAYYTMIETSRKISLDYTKNHVWAGIIQYELMEVKEKIAKQEAQVQVDLNTKKVSCSHTGNYDFDFDTYFADRLQHGSYSKLTKDNQFSETNQWIYS